MKIERLFFWFFSLALWLLLSLWFRWPLVTRSTGYVSTRIDTPTWALEIKKS